MKKLKYILLPVLVVLLTAGCNNWLEVQPYDQMAEDDLLSTNCTARP